MRRYVLICSLLLAAVECLGQGTLNGGLLSGGQMGRPNTSSSSNVITLSDGQVFGDVIRIGHGFFVTDGQTFTDSIVSSHNSHSQHSASLSDAMSLTDAMSVGHNLDYVAQFPLDYADPTQPDVDCPTYDKSFTLGGSAVSGYGPYTCSQSGLQAFFNDWACNANTPPGSPGNGCAAPNWSASHYKDACWHLAIPPSCTVIDTTYTKSAGTAYGVFATGKIDPVTLQMPTKWAVVESSQPLPPNRPACSGGVAPNGLYTDIPEFGGQRNPGCDGHTLTANGKPGGSLDDVARMWTIEESSNIPSGCVIPNCKIPNANSGIGGDEDTVFNTLGGTSPFIDPVFGPFTWTNHIVLRDMQAMPAPGGSQSGASGYNPATPVRFSGGVINPVYSVNNTFKPAWYGSQYIGLERIYVHGSDAGDPGQPNIICGVTGPRNSQHGWQMQGQASTTDGQNFVWVNGDRVGITWTVGATVLINGSPYILAQSGVWATSANVQSTISDLTFQTTVVVPGTAGSTVSFSLTNPPAKYAQGCGDDTTSLIAFNANHSWIGNAYLEKNHWAGAESHCISSGFASPGVMFFYAIYLECGSSGLFLGGGAADSKGTANDVFGHRLVFSRDPAYRQFSAGSGTSPTLPYGCGVFSGKSAQLNTCPFSWAIKNSIEAKMGERVLWVGITCENSWPDGQSGFCWLIDERTISGGGAAGVFDSTGAPLNGTDNIHIQSSWIKNSASGWGIGVRSGTPGNGGGVSKFIHNFDIVNSAVGNLSDSLTWGVGNSEIAAWNAGTQNFYRCLMSRISGIAHCAARPIPLAYVPDVKADIVPGWPEAIFSAESTPVSSIVSSSGVVLVQFGARQDPVPNAPNCTGTNPATGQPGDNYGVVWSAGSCNFIILNGGGSVSASALTAGGTGYVTADIGKTLTLCLVPLVGGVCSQPGAATYSITSVSGGAITGVSSRSMGSGYAVGTAYDANGGSGSGAQVTVSTVVDWSGSFPTRFAYNNSVPLSTNDGSTGNSFDYQPGGSYPSGNLCVDGTTCGNLQWAFVLPTHAYQVTDISPGDGVYTQDVSSFLPGQSTDSSCSGNGYAVGSSSASLLYAISPTAPNGLDVYYSQIGLPDDPASNGHLCIIGNGSGLPNTTRVHHSTFYGNFPVAFVVGGTTAQAINNSFHDNLFIFPTGTNPGKGTNLIGLACTTGEGSHNVGGTAPGDACFDAATYKWYRSTMVGRPVSNWLSIPGLSGNNSPPTLFTNWAAPLPSTVTCAGASPDPSCLGLSSYLSGVSFPLTPCTPSVPFDPLNCPLSSRPWSTNFSLAKLQLSGGSSYSGGINYSQFVDDNTTHQFTCPSGVYCGPHGPYSEDHAGVSSNYTIVLSDGQTFSDSIQTLPPSPHFQHIVVFMQDDRTVDNLGQAFVGIPGFDVQMPGASQALSSCEPQMPGAIVGGSFYPNFLANYAASIASPSDNGFSLWDSCGQGFVQLSDIMQYRTLAQSYATADRFFGNSEGPGAVTAQYLFSAGAYEADGSDNIAVDTSNGCAHSVSAGNNKCESSAGGYPITCSRCFTETSLGDQFAAATPQITWGYWAEGMNFFDDAPSQISSICGTPQTGPICVGTTYTNSFHPSSLTPLSAYLSGTCTLPQMSWIIAPNTAKDHPQQGAGGPAYIQSNVAAIQASPCASSTAILITWTAWGGFWDHVPFTQVRHGLGGYRVPLIVIAPGTSAGYVSHRIMGYGSIVRFIQRNFGITPGSLGHTDATDNDLDPFMFQ